VSQPSFEQSEALQRRLHDLVPGGAHTFARASDQFPEGMAPVIADGIGARVRDVDGNTFVEYGMGMRAVTLGHAYEPVVSAVREAIGRGVSFSRPSALELEAAEDFLGLVTGADMVKFTKNASDATAAAVRLSRAATGRDHVAVSSQPFFSGQDWFVGTLPLDAGVPAAVRDLTHRFAYNDLDALRALLEERPIACVIMEAGSGTAEPAPGYLEGVRALCDAHGAVLVFDETITGFRWSERGAQHVYGVTPDLSCWGKAMGNGFPISALAGKRELMELGGLRTDRDRVFLLSSTHGAETGGLAAFRAVVEAYRETDPIGTMERQGALLAEGVNEAARQAGIEEHVRAIGRPSCLVFETRDAEGEPSQAYRTLFLQEMMLNGVLGQSFVISAAHTDADVELTIDAVRTSLPVYRKALEAGTTDGLLRGRPVAPGHRRRAAPRELSSARQVANA
jgi:glutamate-1-semialdehyde 2,1-aminomutase